MTLRSLVRAAEAYAALGNAVAEQVKAVVNGAEAGDQNPHALAMADEWFLALANRLALADGDTELADDIADLREELREAAEGGA